jgi:hypothetical protein
MLPIVDQDINEFSGSKIESVKFVYRIENSEIVQVYKPDLSQQQYSANSVQVLPSPLPVKRVYGNRSFHGSIFFGLILDYAS